MHYGRYGHSSTLLTNGKVLVAGGSDGRLGLHRTAEIYDPKTQLWTMTGSMNESRASHVATLLKNGRVLIVDGGGNRAEVYNPLTRTWKVTSSMHYMRDRYTTTLLKNGKVLVTGGIAEGLQVHCCQMVKY